MSCEIKAVRRFDNMTQNFIIFKMMHKKSSIDGLILQHLDRK